MTEVTDQINRVYEASGRLMKNSSARAKELIKAGKYAEAQATMNLMFDGLAAKNEIVGAAIGQRLNQMDAILQTPSHSASTISQNTSKSILPHGISKGKIAAIAAGIAVIGGGVLLYRNAQQKKQNTWTSRMEQERMIASQKGMSF